MQRFLEEGYFFFFNATEFCGKNIEIGTWKFLPNK